MPKGSALIYKGSLWHAGGENLSKNPRKTKDCFEGLNRATFAFNQALDGIIFKPVAGVYRVLPTPIKSGVSNSLDNLSNLVTIPNNIMQAIVDSNETRKGFGHDIS